jgi:hypothetical protein
MIGLLPHATTTIGFRALLLPDKHCLFMVRLKEIAMPGDLILRGNNQASKRRVIRVPPEARHAVRIDLMGSNFIEVIAATDISLAGVGINVFHGFEGYNLHDRVEMLILLPLPVHHSISATVRVVHQQDRFFGAEFEGLKRRDYKKLHEYIAFRLKKAGPKLRFLHALQRFRRKL